jgi:hypothetical protein
MASNNNNDRKSYSKYGIRENQQRQQVVGYKRHDNNKDDLDSMILNKVLASSTSHQTSKIKTNENTSSRIDNDIITHHSAVDVLDQKINSQLVNNNNRNNGGQGNQKSVNNNNVNWVQSTESQQRRLSGSNSELSYNKSSSNVAVAYLDDKISNKLRAVGELNNSTSTLNSSATKLTSYSNSNVDSAAAAATASAILDNKILAKLNGSSVTDNRSNNTVKVDTTKCDEKRSYRNKNDTVNIHGQGNVDFLDKKISEKISTIGHSSGNASSTDFFNGNDSSANLSAYNNGIINSTGSHNSTRGHDGNQLEQSTRSDSEIKRRMIVGMQSQNGPCSRESSHEQQISTPSEDAATTKRRMLLGIQSQINTPSEVVMDTDPSTKRRLIVGLQQTPAVQQHSIERVNDNSDRYTRVPTVSNRDNYHIHDLIFDDDGIAQSTDDILDPNDDNTKHSKIIDVKPSSKEFDVDDGLVVAKLVNDDDLFFDDDHQQLPAAEQYDPNQKFAEKLAFKRSSRRKFILSLVLLSVITVSVVFGILSQGKKKINPKDVQQPIHPRLQVGIQHFLSIHFPSDIHKLDNPIDPLHKAMNWMIYNDSQQLVPTTNKTFLQRFIVTHLYYQTTFYNDWTYCYPNNNNTKFDEKNNSTTNLTTITNIIPCQQFSYGKFSGLTNISSAYKLWLSKLSECEWSGIVCNEHGQITSISIGKE